MASVKLPVNQDNRRVRFNDAEKHEQEEFRTRLAVYRMELEEMECVRFSEMSMDTPVQHEVVDADIVIIKPIGPVAGSMEFEFKIENNGERYIDLRNSELETVFRVKKGNGANLDPDEKVAVINYIGATLIETCDIWINGQMITERTPNQAFRAICEVLTSYGEDAAKSWLQGAMFFKDTAGKMDAADPTAADGSVNHGLKERYELTKESKRVVTRSRLHADLFEQPRPLANFIPMRIKLHRNKDEYCLMSSVTGASFKIEIEEMTLRMRTIKLADQLYNELISKSIVYPISRVKVKEYIVPQGGKSFNVPNFVMGALPRKIILGFVSNAAANGAYHLNPLNFKNATLSSLAVMVNGNIIDGSALEMNFADDQFLAGFWTLTSANGKKFQDAGTMIQRKDYKGGYALYTFDLSPSLCDDQYRDEVRSGDISIACKFTENIGEALTLCAYLQFENTITVNPAREVTTDFQT